MASRDAGTLPALTGKLLAGDYLREWLASLEPAVRGRTFDSYAGILRTHLMPRLAKVPLAKLERHLTKLPSNITAKQMDSLESRLSALGSRAGTAAMPKGPLPGGAKMRGVQRTVRRR